MGVHLVPLTVGAPFDIRQDIVFQSRPPVTLLYQVNRAADTWVSMSRRVMVVMYDGPFLLVVTSDHVLPLLFPSSCYLLELVGVDPGADDVFVLSLVLSYYLDKDLIR